MKVITPIVISMLRKDAEEFSKTEVYNNLAESHTVSSAMACNPDYTHTISLAPIDAYDIIRIGEALNNLNPT